LHATTPPRQSAYVLPCGTQNALATGLLTVKKRVEPKNHSLSFLIGPPIVASRSRYLPIRSTDRTPCDARKDDRLLLWRLLLSNPQKNNPGKSLPPPRGAIFTLFPPAGESALPPPVW